MASGAGEFLTDRGTDFASYFSYSKREVLCQHVEGTREASCFNLLCVPVLLPRLHSNKLEVCGAIKFRAS